MKESVQPNHNELDLIDLLKMLLSKVKLIIMLTLVAAVAGGSFGFAFTLIGTHNFGTTVEFYITPNAPDSRILHLLSSERFAEKLLLDKNGLPEGASGADYEAALAAKLRSDEANKALDAAKEASRSAPRELASAQKNYEEKQKAYQDLYDLLSIYQSASDEIAKQPEHIEKMKQYEKEVEAAQAEKKAAEKTYYDANQNNLEANHNLEAAKEAATDARKEADDLSENVLKVWREQSQNKKKIALINDSLSYEYVQDKNVKSSDGANTQFLIVSISVKKDEQLAKQLLANICEKLPVYVEENTDTAETVEETDCILISTAAEIEDLGKSSLVKQVVKYTLISAITTLAATCIIIIWVGVKRSIARHEYDYSGDIDEPLV